MKIFPAIEARLNKRALDIWARAQLPQALFVNAAAAQDAETEILLYDYIGWGGIMAEDFVLALAKAGPGPLAVRINSPGGDVFDGMAIYNALRARTSPVRCIVDGLAASAASFIALAGSSMEMSEMSMLMVHKAWGFTIGNDDDHLDQAMVLGKIDGQLAETYARKTGKSAADMLAVMKAETWYTSTDAKSAGLCDTILLGPPKEPAASARLMTANNASRMRIENRVNALAASLPAYDPDNDGDNDAEEALGMVNAAALLLQEAIECLTGVPGDDEEDANTGAAPDALPIVPGARARLRNLKDGQGRYLWQPGLAVETATAETGAEVPAEVDTTAADTAHARVEAMKRRLRLAEVDAA